MTYYVHREREGQIGWVGPIRSERQADRECAAWRECGWETMRLDATKEVHAEVRAWSKAVRAARG